MVNYSSFILLFYIDLKKIKRKPAYFLRSFGKASLFSTISNKIKYKFQAEPKYKSN